MADLTPAEQAQYDQLIAAIADLRARFERAAIAKAEHALTDSGSVTSDGAGVPWPNTCHPAYNGNATVRDWVNRRGPYADLHTLRLPVFHRLVYSLAAAPDPLDDAPAVNTLSRRRAVGRAPYVGRPFVYVWDVATDELGRHVAGDTRIQYLDGRRG